MQVCNVTNNSADLTWKPPNNDGGSPLTGYTIEFKLESRTFWTKCETLNENKTTYTVPKLTEDAEYFFRVFAINAEGQSKPAETTEPTKLTKEISKLFIIYLNKIYFT